MCIFHEALSVDTEQGFYIAPVVVALSGLQKGSTLFNELSQVERILSSNEIGAGANLLLQVAKDPYRYLGKILSFEAERGNGDQAVNAILEELARSDDRQRFFDAVAPSERTLKIAKAESVDVALAEVAIAGHSSRPAFLEWFRENPSGLEAPKAIQVLDRVSQDVLVALSKKIEVISCCPEISPGRSGLTGSFAIPKIPTLPIPVKGDPKPGCCHP